MKNHKAAPTASRSCSIMPIRAVINTLALYIPSSRAEAQVEGAADAAEDDLLTKACARRERNEERKNEKEQGD